MWQRIIRIGLLIAIIGVVFVFLHPVHSKILNLALLGCVSGLWIGCTALAWKRKPIRLALLAIPILLAIPLLLPGREIDSDELRKNYVRRMSAFEGIPYYWGGESTRGIDCSGLPRRAFRDALLSHGLRTANGRAFRSYLEQWWFDASAKALSESYRNYTTPLGGSGTIQELDLSGLLPGDLAVTTNGVHILAYVGEGKWIQADPGVDRVITLHGKNDENTWFKSPVTTHRWMHLTGK